MGFLIVCLIPFVTQFFVFFAEFAQLTLRLTQAGDDSQALFLESYEIPWTDTSTRGQIRVGFLWGVNLRGFLLRRVRDCTLLWRGVARGHTSLIDLGRLVFRGLRVGAHYLPCVLRMYAY